jgi:flagellar biosynthesis protein FliQ
MIAHALWLQVAAIHEGNCVKLKSGLVLGWGMQGDHALGLMSELMWNCMLVAGPVLAAALITGLLISVFQVATQLQEMTLSYVPKMFVSAVVLLVLGPWMIHRIAQFAIKVIAIIPDLG